MLPARAHVALYQPFPTLDAKILFQKWMFGLIMGPNTNTLIKFHDANFVFLQHYSIFLTRIFIMLSLLF